MFINMLFMSHLHMTMDKMAQNVICEVIFIRFSPRKNKYYKCTYIFQWICWNENSAFSIITDCLTSVNF